MATLTQKSDSISYNPPSESYWTLSGVKHRGENQTYRVFGQMTPSMTQDDLIEKYGLKIPNSQLVWALTDRAYELRNSSPNEAERLRNFLRQCFRQRSHTSSRAIYMPEGEIDRAAHNYGTPEQYFLDANLVGVDGRIEDIPNKKVLVSILGTDDVGKINKVSQWVNGTGSSISRVNLKPNSVEVQRTVGFYANVVRLGFGCGGDLAYVGPSLRVERIE